MDMEKQKELFKKGTSALEVGRLDEAEEAFNEILAENPVDEHVLNKMGVIYIYRKDQEKAREYFQRAIEIEPAYAPAITNIGNIELEEGDMNKAEMLYRQALRLDPDYGPAHNNLAHIMKKTGRVSEAVKHMRKAQKAGTMALNMNSDRSKKTNRGCLTVIILAVVALILWYMTK